MIEFIRRMEQIHDSFSIPCNQTASSLTDQNACSPTVNNASRHRVALTDIANTLKNATK
ncbi:hypothetical protein CHS0354_025811, partial [Potamilus streckersoni]